jgi:hypothetical protein
MNVTIEAARAAILARLKAKVTLTSDVRELESQRVGYSYPCLRYAAAFEPTECGDWRVVLTVYVWSEGDSSLEANQIVDEVIAGLHERSCVSAGVRLQVIRLTGAPRFVRGDDRLWRGEAVFSLQASAA